MVATANLILLAVSIICFATGETVQGCAFLAVMYTCWVVDRIQKSGGEEE
ncbi:hypothetical protein A5819_003442 [Enterococcus sp. 7E2_DIV0204]|nr:MULTISPECIES: hypothetical protein [unclassified Enterococcus]OTN86592.1 hypothetical protein A5819_003442 [Enterococcus sp. 7E2_DIV0204]OTP47619.1 hypothetical protein A5884_003374 [Enterococcus sp. 7D2_DIV0200]